MMLRYLLIPDILVYIYAAVLSYIVPGTWYHEPFIVLGCNPSDA